MFVRFGVAPRSALQQVLARCDSTHASPFCPASGGTFCYVPKQQVPMQVALTARDRYGNVIPTGDAGFEMVYPAADALVDGTFSRTVSAGVTTFAFRIRVAGIYVLRFEAGTGALVHQSKFRIKPGGLSHSNSRFLSLPAAFPVGGTLVATMQLRDAYGNVFVTDDVAAQFELSATDANDRDRAVKVRPPGHCRRLCPPSVARPHAGVGMHRRTPTAARRTRSPQACATCRHPSWAPSTMISKASR